MKKYLFALAIAAVLPLLGGMVFVQESSGAEPTRLKLKVGEDSTESQSTLDDLLVVPNGTPEEMLTHFRKVLVAFNETDYESQEDQLAAYEKMILFSIDLGEKIILKNPSDDEKKIALSLKFRGLSFLAQKDETHKKALFDFAESLSKMDDLGPLAEVAKTLPMNWGMRELVKSENFVDDAKAYREKLIDFVQKNPSDMSASIMVEFLEVVDMFAPEKEAFTMIKESGDLFRPLLKERDPRLVMAFDETLEKAEFYGSLYGKEFKLEGTDLAGKPFNVQSLKGKVVLIDFWATWCPPCLAEVPNMKAAYEKYKEKGFEIVGYSVDEDVDTLKMFIEEEKTPWVSLSQKLSVEAKLEDFSETYKVVSIPTMFLLDKEGKLVSMRARGEDLEKVLEQLLGETEAK